MHRDGSRANEFMGDTFSSLPFPVISNEVRTMLYTEPLPPSSADDAGRDVDGKLMRACYRMLEEVGELGFDFLPSYAAMLAALDAKERDINDTAKEMVRS